MDTAAFAIVHLCLHIAHLAVSLIACLRRVLRRLYLASKARILIIHTLDTGTLARLIHITAATFAILNSSKLR